MSIFKFTFFAGALGDRLVRASSPTRGSGGEVGELYLVSLLKKTGKASRCLTTRTTCWDPVCTIDDIWCSSEHYFGQMVAFWLRSDSGSGERRVWRYCGIC